MAPGPSRSPIPVETDAAPALGPASSRLLEVASASIAHGLVRGRPLAVDPNAYPVALRAQRATFVTLEQAGALRGCVGVLEPVRALVADVAANAFAAAFRDPRFDPLAAVELEDLHLHVSVLSASQPLVFRTQEELCAQLRPGRDGLILEERGRRATFLPAVWESLPDPELFVRHLKAKAGLPAGYWSEHVTAARYTVEAFAGPYVSDTVATSGP